ncbi:hypothetical protein FGO68_gene2284 [Halteria grandinella]|uniref:Transmembrane protein n=1 Tax=Halteria grandinella TaxID=5974 RepID=A0A8J8NHX3_HALGN|nr:hypothetical protein FGO68_gene2284 [Halteria grandinella]
MTLNIISNNIYIFSYDGVFALSLFKINENNEEIEVDAGDFEKQENQILMNDGCFSSQRSIEINFKLQLWLDSLITSSSMYFSDLATAENFHRVYIVRNDLTIFEIDVGSGLGEITLNPVSKQFNISNSTQEQNEFYLPHPYLIDDEGSNRVYAITESGAVSFSTLQSISNIEFRTEEFMNRKQIFNVHKNSKAQIIVIACGSEGIDIYDILKDGLLKHKKQLTPKDLDLDGAIIIDVDSNDDETKLFLLDKQSGLIIYDIKDINQITKIMNVEIQNTKNFDFYHNTFFIVAQTNTFLEYAVEVFINFELQQYYFNSLYLDEMSINSVNVFEHYAVLVGEDGHKIVYHSIYNKFINQSLIQHTYFQEENLLKMKEYDITKKYKTTNRILVGIAKYEFKYLEIQLNDPTITCYFAEPTIQNYKVKLNSTSCKSKTEQQDQSPFSICQVTHEFSYTAEQVNYLIIQGPGNKTKYLRLTILMYSLLVGSIWLVILTIYLYKRWGYKIKFLFWKRKQLIATQPFNQEVEMQNQS